MKKKICVLIIMLILCLFACKEGKDSMDVSNFPFKEGDTICHKLSGEKGIIISVNNHSYDIRFYNKEKGYTSETVYTVEVLKEDECQTNKSIQ